MRAALISVMASPRFLFIGYLSFFFIMSIIITMLV